MTCVVKIGGSLCDDPRLSVCLDMFVELGAGKVVIVPGGGPYADVVHIQQKRWKFSDEIAHALAVRAMDQFALQLTGINTRLVLAAKFTELNNAMSKSDVAVWLPSELVLAAPDIAPTWDVTSDSLAAWLARKLNAGRLILVKSCPVPADSNLETLSQLGVLDQGFLSMAPAANCSIDVLSITDLDRVRKILIQIS